MKPDYDPTEVKRCLDAAPGWLLADLWSTIGVPDATRLAPDACLLVQFHEAPSFPVPITLVVNGGAGRTGRVWLPIIPTG